MKNTFHYTITPIWFVIRHIRKDILTKLGDSLPKKYLDDSLICAIELAENAIKYGESVPSFPYIQFHFEHDKEYIDISVTNGVAGLGDLEFVTSTIDRLKSADDPKKLYFERLNQLMKQDRPGTSRLGILRIVNETDFKLEYVLKENAITIIARLKIRE